MPRSEFLSTLSLRRATFANFDGFYWWIISIHALLAESDSLCMLYDTSSLIFLSTLSLRRATIMIITISIASKFLSTLSLRRATHPQTLNHPHRTISIHALLAESDRVPETLVPRRYQFLSTLSLRRATRNAEAVSKYMIFLSTLSLRRATLWVELV